MFEAPSRPYTAGRVKEGSMHNPRPRCYEIPSVYVALAIKHAVERKKPTAMQGATDRHRRSQLAARSARPPPSIQDLPGGASTRRAWMAVEFAFRGGPRILPGPPGWPPRTVS